MSLLSTRIATCLTVLALGLTGCKSETNTAGPDASLPSPTTGSHAGHAHPTEGPHHGELVELGDDQYHAEVLHDAQSVTIYILNGSADSQVPIEATEITINTQYDGHPKQFKLAAAPDANDPPGKASRFVSNDQQLAGHLDEHDAETRLVLTINGKSYRGSVQHDHAHHAHDEP